MTAEAHPHAEARARLSERGLAASAQRVALLALIMQEPEQHLTADELFQRLRPQFPTLSRATVYNNLGALAEARLIEKLDTYDGARFGPEARPHINLVCDACGAIDDVLVGDTAIEELVRRAAAVTTFDAGGVSMSIAGRCANCRSQG